MARKYRIVKKYNRQGVFNDVVHRYFIQWFGSTLFGRAKWRDETQLTFNDKTGSLYNEPVSFRDFGSACRYVENMSKDIPEDEIIHAGFSDGRREHITAQATEDMRVGDILIVDMDTRQARLARAKDLPVKT